MRWLPVETWKSWPDPPALANPDVRVIRSVTGDACTRILALPQRLDVGDRLQRFYPQVTLERKTRPRNKIGKIGGGVGHKSTLAEPFAPVVLLVVGPPPHRFAHRDEAQ